MTTVTGGVRDVLFHHYLLVTNLSHIKVKKYFTEFSEVKKFDSNTLEHTPDWNEHKIIFCALFNVRVPPTNVSETLLFLACPSIDLSVHPSVHPSG